MEFNLVLKKFRAGMTRIAYLYPSTYEAMLSSLPTHMIYYLANSIDEVILERFHIHRFQGEEPPPRSIETGTPLDKFDLIITSLHYELSVIDLLRCLIAAGMDPRKDRRKQVIIAGGPVSISNPIPYSDFIDAFIIGEIENTIPRLIHDWVETKDKKQYLEKISSYSDVYVPGYNDGARRSYVESLDNAFYPIRQIQNDEIEPVYGRGFLLETSRGCRYWCRFCMEGRLFKPYRVRSFNLLKNLVDNGIRLNRVNRVITYSLCFLGSIHEKRLLEYFVEQGISAVIPSLRIDHIDNDVLELIRMLGQRTITVAPESFLNMKNCVFGKYCGKDLLSSLEQILEKGFDLKIYMIVGVKGIAEKEVEEALLVERLARRARSMGRKVVISVNPLIPKPRTPFQWIGMLRTERIRSLFKALKSRLRKYADFRDYDIRWAVMQAAISLADKNISKTLLETALQGGGLSGWRRALRSTGFNIEYVFSGYDPDEELPWSKILIDEGHERLVRGEYELLLSLLGEALSDHG